MAIRVFQWSTGTVGRRAARAVVDDPRMELVGARVYAPDKVGRDVGEIIGIDPLGVVATDAGPEAVDADVVIHTPLPSLIHGDDPDEDLHTICSLLARGVDVVTTVGFLLPAANGADVERAIATACESGGSTFHGTGLNPGWMGDLLPLAMSALSRTIERIHVTEITEFSRYPSPEIMFSMMGFGKDPETFEHDGERRRRWLDRLFEESIRLVAGGIGTTLDDVERTLELDVASARREVAAGTIEAGTVAGQHWTWTGRSGGRDLIVHETVWRMGADTGPDWPTGNHSVVIDGDPAMRIELAPRWLADGLGATAYHAVNAVSAVHAAAPGIVTRLDLPPLHGRAVA